MMIGIFLRGWPLRTQDYPEEPCEPAFQSLKRLTLPDINLLDLIGELERDGEGG
jgi:hypothetical protein